MTKSVLPSGSSGIFPDGDEVRYIIRVRLHEGVIDARGQAW